MNGRNFIDLKRIINNIPIMESQDQKTLLADLKVLKDVFEDAYEKTSTKNVKLFAKSKVDLVEKVKNIINNKDFDNHTNLELIKELYSPIFEEKSISEPFALSLDDSIMQDLNKVKIVHPHGEEYDMIGFIELLLYESIIEHLGKKEEDNNHGIFGALSTMFS
jgi:hypothetical protein